MLDFFCFIRYNKLNKNKGEQNKKRKGESTRNVILTQKNLKKARYSPPKT